MVSIVIISSKGVRAVRKFKEDEMGINFYTKAKKHFPEPEYKVHLVHNTSHIPKPPDYEPKRKGTFYCPYCGEERRFYNTEYGSKICPICRVSDNDYYVKNYNGLWDRIPK